jgi:adenosylcobinamide kinase/adenosylcobinamide-phosphate guanylyltransferase
MILIIGGAASGKREYLRSLGFDDEQIADAVLDGRPALANLHQLVFADPESAPDLLEPLLAKQAVTCDEVGAGIIPADPAERNAREATGRICNQLAQQATEVVRMVAGIPVRIKG